MWGAIYASLFMISASILKVARSYVHLEGICVPIFFIISFRTVVLEKSAKYKKFRSPGCFMLIAWNLA